MVARIFVGNVMRFLLGLAAVLLIRDGPMHRAFQPRARTILLLWPWSSSAWAAAPASALCRGAGTARRASECDRRVERPHHRKLMAELPVPATRVFGSH